MAVAGVARLRAVGDVRLRGVEVAHAPVADVAQEVGVGEQLEHERGVGGDEFAQAQARGFQHQPRHVQPTGSAARATRSRPSRFARYIASSARCSSVWNS